MGDTNSDQTQRNKRKADALTDVSDDALLSGSDVDAPLQYIFLDVDGVLNNVTTRGAAYGLREYEETLALAGAPELLDNLAHIVAKTGAKIVLSSTWRLGGMHEPVAERLATRHLSIVGRTPELTLSEVDEIDDDGDETFLPAVERAIEISRWLKAEGGQHLGYVAIDDMDLTQGAPGLAASRFVKTSDREGLTAEKAQEAVEKLLSQRGVEAAADAKRADAEESRASAAAERSQPVAQRDSTRRIQLDPSVTHDHLAARSSVCDDA